MATNNAINLNATGIAKYDGAGTFSATTVTQHDIIIGGASNALTSLALTSGQLAIGNTGNDPSAATITAGTGIGVVNGAGSITINANGGGMTWSAVTGTTQAAAVNNGYISNNASANIVYTLPATAAIGDSVAIVGLAAGTGSAWYTLTANTGQTIHFGGSVTSTAGTLTATNQFDTVMVTCIVANTTWTVRSSVGNFTVA